MGIRRYTDLRVRGVTYPTAQAAASALGVTEKAVYDAVKGEYLDRLGLRQCHPAPLPVRVRGETYASARDAARALGVSRAAIYHAIRRGAEDRVGLPPPPCRVRVRPVTIGPLTFDAMADADRALGFPAGFVSATLRKGRKRGRERILAAAMRVAAERAGPRPRPG